EAIENLEDFGDKPKEKKFFSIHSLLAAEKSGNSEIVRKLFTTKSVTLPEFTSDTMIMVVKHGNLDLVQMAYSYYDCSSKAHNFKCDCLFAAIKAEHDEIAEWLWGTENYFDETHSVLAKATHLGCLASIRWILDQKFSIGYEYGIPAMHIALNKNYVNSAELI